MTPAPSSPSLQELIALIRQHGNVDDAYLAAHYNRFVATKREFLGTWDRGRGNRLLDVGAHWLHQSLLYAIDGFRVTATDLPLTMQLDGVRSLARAFDIRLVCTPDLSSAGVFSDLPDNSFDVVLFSEIVEHITFNPIAMWREIYRVAAPGARIVVTTPNYYALRGRAFDVGRFLRGFGGGLAVLDLLRQHTYSHHWKEFSRKELIYYFCVLSPDFVTVKSRYMPDFHDANPRRRMTRLAQRIERLLPPLRPNLHLEVELVRKEHGIKLEPRW